ncbi:hypothetical protein AURDEDRAFT_173509 [Auricularia subglabra TFB-10046 SS5]|nr:hypothetical protein AURDEDRAFT_173509 [Auricularia subglabra TFB-10046 SS5]
MNTLWISTLLYSPPSRLYFEGDARRDVNYWVIDSIYRVYALHAFTLDKQGTFGEFCDPVWQTRALEIRGALVYFFMSGWMLPSTTSQHPGWRAAKMRAAAATAEAFGALQAQHGILRDLDLSRFDETLRMLGKDVPHRENAQTALKKRLNRAYRGLVSAGIELARCGPPISIPIPGVRTYMGEHTVLTRGAHRDNLLVRLHRFVDRTGPEDPACQRELFEISCELARGQVFYDIERLERLEQRISSAQWMYALKSEYGIVEGAHA